MRLSGPNARSRDRHLLRLYGALDCGRQGLVVTVWNFGRRHVALAINATRSQAAEARVDARTSGRLNF
jgi:hypothetical protein